MFIHFSSNKSIESPRQRSALRELREAAEEVNDFFLEKHGRVAAAALKAAEDNRVRSDKAEQDRRKNLSLEAMLRQLKADGDKRMRRQFFGLIRQRCLAAGMARERAQKGKGRATFPAENYCPFDDDEEDKSGRGSEVSGLIYTSIPINLPLGPSPRGPPSTPSTLSPPLPWTPKSGSPVDSTKPLESITIRNPAPRPISKKTTAATATTTTNLPRLNPLANPFPDPSLGIRTQAPARANLPSPFPLPVYAPVPAQVPGGRRHRSSDNTAPFLPPAVYVAGAQLHERLRGVSLGPVRAVASQMVYDQRRQTQHQTMREYELQRAKGRI